MLKMTAHALHRLTGAAIAVLIASAAVPAGAATTFPAQSLIVPMQSSFQDACGMVSSYGLVYDVLRANDGWRATPKTTGRFTGPITIHWVYSTAKASPNRCVPTNVDTVFNGATALSPLAGINDKTWNDGCDFALTNAAGGAPATVIDNTGATADQGLGTTSWSTIDTTSPLGIALANPNFQAKTVAAAGVATKNKDVTTLQYAGGAFVISAPDVPGFLDLLSGAASVRDAAGNVIDFSPFRTGKGTCAASVNGSGQAVFGTAANSSANEHYVTIHRAQVSFTAEDNARMNGTPPRIGLLQSVDHDFADETGVSVLTGLGRSGKDLSGNVITGTPTGIKGTQLKFYLKSAGLDFPQAGGCPKGAYNDPSVNGYNAALAGLCGPSNTAGSGQIYDNLDAVDLASGLVNGSTNGKPNYSVVWAPHWEGRPWKTAIGTSGCDAACMAKAQANLAAFLDDTTTPRGFLGECATIGFLEGAVNTVEQSTYKTTCNPGYTGTPSNTNPGCFPNERFVNDVYGTQSLTCQKDASGNCLAAGGSASAAPIGLVHDTRDIGIRLDNCTNPTAQNGNHCIHFANPNSAFSQVGDLRWWSYSGGVSNYFPSSTATYAPGAQRLLYSVDSLNTATIKTNPASLAVGDNVTLIQRGGDKRKAQMVYLGGHNYTPDVAGTRIALNTLMALGTIIDTKESAFVGPTLYNSNGTDLLLVPTYNRILSQSVPASFRTFDPQSPKDWQFPYHTGNLRVDSPSALSSGANAFSNAAQQYTAVMPAPGQRNLFTYLGGHVSTNAAELPVSYRSPFGHGVAQVGWKPVNFDQRSLNAGSSSFVDSYHIGPVKVPGSAPAATYPGMVAGGNQVSDLQETLELSVTSQDIGSDNGATTAEQSAIVAKLQDGTQVNNTRWLIQMVRGFCYPTTPLTNFAPAKTDCAQGGASSSAELGALVHSQVAVVPASQLVLDAPTGKHRPTVAYVGGLDGQLHAFYMPSDALDSGYTGPAKSITGVNAPASGVFTSPSNGSFTPPAPGTALWSVIPPGQLPFLKTNTAQVDSSPAVMDVFGDFDGSGIRSYRTVLVASAGGGNREIFALDVTNPLNPTLLWDIQSSFDPSLPYAPGQLAADDTGLGQNARAFRWQNRCRAADAQAGTCTATEYVLPPGTDNGRIDSGLYNYAHLGASQSVSTGVLRRNNAPIYGAFVATNEPGGHGIHVFGIDLVTGSKLWEWNNPYDRESYQSTNPNKYAGTGNTPPAGVAVVSRSLDDQVNSVYAGDDEGSLWELDAEDGVNTTGYSAARPAGIGCPDAKGSCNFSLNHAYGYDQSLFGTGDIPQPISTLPTIFRVRSDIAQNGLFSKYVGQVMLAYGTAGTDAAASLTLSDGSPVSGAVHLMPIGIGMRDVPADLNAGTSQAAIKIARASTLGVDYEAGSFKDGSGTAFLPQALSGGNRIYGSIAVDQNGRLFFGTTTGSVTDIDARGLLSGNVYQINTAASSQPVLSVAFTALGGIGGTLGMITSSSNQLVSLVASTDQNLNVMRVGAPPLPSKATAAGISPPATGLVGWLLRKAGREY